MAKKSPRVTVYDSRIAAAFQPGGTLFQNMRRVGKDNYDAAVHYAPKRTGLMAKTIRFSVTPSGKYHARYTVRPTVDYAIFSLAGTTGPITAKGGRLLWVRPRPYSRFMWRAEYASIAHGRTPLFWVNGQKQNDWLGLSLHYTLTKHRLL